MSSSSNPAGSSSTHPTDRSTQQSQAAGSGGFPPLSPLQQLEEDDPAQEVARYLGIPYRPSVTGSASPTPAPLVLKNVLHRHPVKRAQLQHTDTHVCQMSEVRGLVDLAEWTQAPGGRSDTRSTRRRRSSHHQASRFDGSHSGRLPSPAQNQPSDWK
jgi:hypothetical protein